MGNQHQLPTVCQPPVTPSRGVMIASYLLMACTLLLVLFLVLGRWRLDDVQSRFRFSEVEWIRLLARLDRLGDLVAEHADTDALWRLIEGGAPAGLPLLPPGSGFSPR